MGFRYIKNLSLADLGFVPPLFSDLRPKSLKIAEMEAEDLLLAYFGYLHLALRAEIIGA